MKGWLVYSLVAVLVWGVWGFLTKWSVDRLGSLPAYFLFSLGSIVVPLALLPATKIPAVSGPFWVALGAGLLGGIGTLLLARAFATGRGNVVIPITAQYVLVSVLLTTFFHHEPLPVRKLIGIGFSIAAIVLLSME